MADASKQGPFIFLVFTSASSSSSLDVLFSHRSCLRCSLPLSLSASSRLSCVVKFFSVFDATARHQCRRATHPLRVSAQGTEEREEERRDGLCSQLREGRQGQILRGVCVCVCACCECVHQHASCIDVSVLHCLALEVNKQAQVSFALTCSYR